MDEGEPRNDPWSRWRWPLILLAIAFLVGGLAGVLLQVEVDGDDVAATRACGSPFDVITDRSGWETWWAGDLDEPDFGIRRELVRTSACPGAINQRIIISSTLAIAGVLVLVTAAVFFRQAHGVAPGVGGDALRLRRGGAITAGVGAVLSVAGLVAVIVLLADADSTLFLYTSRLVVAVAGLIVLVPAVALTVGGWAIHLVGRRLDRYDDG